MKKLSRNYHDWNILRISSDVEVDILEFLVASDHLQSIIRFNGVKRCRVDNFTIGNIILDIEIFTGVMFTDSLIKRTAFDKLFSLPNESKFYEAIIDKINNESLSYVEISPSYGCFAMILFSDFEEISLD
jgi:hypothetical protein